jgi:hypothetical protein
VIQTRPAVARGEAAVREARLPPKGNFDQFLSVLLTRESGLDPARFAWYVQNYDSRVIRYPRVTAPGHPIRNCRSGAFELQELTVAEYFWSIGVDDLFDSSNADCIAEMRYRAVNVLGFTGYQIGESILIATGHYVPEGVDAVIDGVRARCERYYCAPLPPSTWANGCREHICYIPSSPRPILCTDTNRWRGRFTGKDDVSTYDDLKRSVNQERVIRTIVDTNVAQLVSNLDSRGLRLPDVIGRRHVFRPFSDLPSIQVQCTLSGLLAASHLCGADAVVDFLHSGTLTCDEFATPIWKYLVEFRNYSTPYDDI